MMRLHTGCTEKDLLPKIVTMIERICVDAPEKTFLTPDQQSEETHLCTTTNRELGGVQLHNVQQSHSFYIFGYVLYFNIFIFFIFSYFFYATNKEEVCNYCFTMCKKNNAQCATTSFFSSQPQAVTTINPNLQLPPMVVTTSFHQRKYSHNCTCQIDTQYTAHSIHQK